MKERHFDWQIAALFVLAMTLASGRLVMTRWTDGLMLAQGAAIFGGILGVMLAASLFSTSVKRWLAIGYTPFVLAWLLLWMAPGAEDLQTRLAGLGGRMWYSLVHLVRAEEVNDPLLFVTFACLVFWMTGILSGQAIVTPRRILAGLLPPSLFILLIQYYDGYPASRIWVVSVYLGILLLIIGRKNYLQSLQTWREKGVFTGPEPEFDLSRSITTAAVIIVLVAWALPTPASALPAAARWWRENSRPFRTMQERIGKALAALNDDQAPPVERYGDILTLGSQADQGQGILFRVRTEADPLPRYYWRARVYDTYNNGRWQASQLLTRSFEPGSEEELPVPQTSGEIVSFEFEWLFAAQTTLLSHPQPAWISRPVEIRYQALPDGSQEVNRMRATTVPAPGERYQVRSLVYSPTISELREAGEVYPDWVRERYLALPENLSARVIALAVSITEDAPTPYDKAERITAYLRKNITYDENFPSLPTGADVLERFLFDLQRGYCTYYATAEVILLRSVGVPARLAVGYAQGEQINGAYVVRSKDAHAWPEVYFPEIGWVEFEPTANQLPILRPSGVERPPLSDREPIRPERDRPQMDDEGLTPPENPVTSQPIRAEFPYRLVFGWIIIPLFVALSGYGLWRLHLRQPFPKRALETVLRYYEWRGASIPNWLGRWQRWSNLTEIERAFHAINQSLGWLKRGQPESLTPNERVQLLKKRMPQAVREIDILAGEHEKNLYSPHPANPARAKKAAWRIRIAVLRSFLTRILQEQSYE